MAKESRFWETKAFKKLDAEWAKKLERSGFEDIEQRAEFDSGAPDGNLKSWVSSLFSTPGVVNSFESKSEYYRLAGQFLHSYTFGHDNEKELWRMHGDGQSIDTIVATFKAKSVHYLLGRKINRRFVHETLKRLVKVMLKGTR